MRSSALFGAAACLFAATSLPKVADAQVAGSIALDVATLEACPPECGPKTSRDFILRRTLRTLPDVLGFSGEWRYAPGDVPDAASPDLDDSKWALAKTALLEPEMPPGWTGDGWFRLHVEVAE